MLSVRLPEDVDVEKRLDKLVEKTKRAKSFYVREALELTFDILEKFPTEDDREQRQAALAKIVLGWLKPPVISGIERLKPRQRLVLMLRLARDSCKMTVEQAAKRIGINKTLLDEVENGRGRPLPEPDMKAWIKALLKEWDADKDMPQDDAETRKERPVRVVRSLEESERYWRGLYGRDNSTK